MKKIVIIGLGALFSTATLGYEVETHADLSGNAALNSILGDDTSLKHLGLMFPIDSEQQKFPNSKGTNATVLNLIRDGARFEDDFPRPINHFFDPYTGKGLGIGYPSPAWALEDQQDQSGQENSYQDARQYFHDALTNASGTDTDRNASWGRLFQTLGQIVHHVQDMAQPQHVRLDAHCDQWYCVGPLKSPSAYEKYTDGIRGTLPYTGYPPVNTLGLDAEFLAVPRQFWHGGGNGIAEFTNTNFVSAGTNFDTARYPSPSLSNSVGRSENANALLASAGMPIPTQCLPPNPPCEMAFIETPVTDVYRPGQSGVNPRASTYSIFDQDLKARNESPVFSLNRFNFDAAHEFLIPRAVGYSAGLLNYFFRGRLEAGSTDGGAHTMVGAIAGRDA